MARITFKDDTFETVGDLPAKGSVAFPFALTKTELTECILEDFKGKRVVLNMFPSIDTSVCAASVRRFNQEASELENCAVLCISADLPFAHNRFCEAEGLKDVIPLSVFRSPGFGKDYGVTIINGPLRGLLARAIVIVDVSGKIIYTELVPDIAQEPDYDSALEALS